MPVTANGVSLIALPPSPAGTDNRESWAPRRTPGESVWARREGRRPGACARFRRYGAQLDRVARGGGPIEAPIREVQREQCHADERWAMRFEFREVADPRAGEAEREQHQRPETARRGQDCSNAAGGEHALDVRFLRHLLKLLVRSSTPGVTLLP